MVPFHRSAIGPLALAAAFAIAGTARAEIVSATPALPLLGDPYTASVGAGCFIAAGYCVANGSLTLTSLVSSKFENTSQVILTDADYSATLSTLAGTVIGPVNLTGTVEQTVIGRTTATATGSWSTIIDALSLNGPVLGDTLTLTLDTGNPSSGTTSIDSIGTTGDFAIDSFLAVYADVSLNSPTPLHTSVGPIVLTATPAPEPDTLALFAMPLLLLAAARSFAQPRHPGTVSPR